VAPAFALTVKVVSDPFTLAVKITAFAAPGSIVAVTYPFVLTLLLIKFLIASATSSWLSLPEQLATILAPFIITVTSPEDADPCQ